MEALNDDAVKAMLPTGVYVFVPAFGESVYTNTLRSLAGLSHTLGLLGVPLNVGSFSWPDIADIRSAAFSAWFDAMPTMSHMLMIDADMGFKPDLVVDMLALQQPFVGTVYPKKTPERHWVVRHLDPQNARFTRDGIFMQVDGVGFGVTLIRRDGAEKLVAAHPELTFTNLDRMPCSEALLAAGAKHHYRVFDQIRDADGVDLSEDYAFCERWKAAVGPLWAAIGHEVTHMGPNTWKGRFLDEQVEKVNGKS